TGKWDGSIPAASISALSAGSRTIYARVRDLPGRTTTVGLPIIVDKTPPTLSFSSPAASASINKTLAVRGVANDDQVLTGVVLEIWNQSTSLWNSVATITGTDAYNWLLPAFDTTLFDSATYDRDSGTAGTQIRLRATATDEAGNANATETTLDLTIDQNSDRPVLKLSNIVPTGTSILKMTRTVYGTVSDDDGTPAAFSVSEDNASWTAITLDGGNWSYDASAGDGAKNLYFRVTDASGTVFSTDAANEPRVQNGAGYWETYVTFRVDTVTPEIDSTISVDKALPYDFAVDADTVTLTANLPFGGPSAKFSIKALARDANGIATVSVNVPGIGDVATTVLGSVVAYPAYTAYSTPEIDVGSLGDGAKDVVVTVTDGSGLTSTATRTIIVDNTAPELHFLTPATATIVNGELIVKGTASDALSQLASVTYRVGKNYLSDSPLVPDGSNYLWEIPFSGATALTAFSNATEAYVDTSTGVTLYILPVVVRATDKAGNIRESTPIDGTGTRPNVTSLTSAALVGNTRVAVGQIALIGGIARVITAWNSGTGTITWSGAVLTTETTYSVLEYSLRIDPDGDAPKATISYPATDTTLGGNVRIYGTALDDDGVASVWMQIDTNQDGSFTVADDAIGTWYNGGNGQLTTGSSNWNKTINESGEFDPAGASPTHLLVRVRAQDIYSTFGPWSTPIEILIDKNVPLIGSSYSLKLDPDADPNNGNEIPYTYGMHIKGNWTLRGSIEDETALLSVSVTGSLNGTLISQPSWFTLTTVADAPYETKYKRIDLAIPISCPADSAASWDFMITAADVSEPSREASQALRLAIDTKAPTGTLNAVTTPPLVQQSNGWYKIKGTADDVGSDIDRVEVYFVRRGNGSTTFDRIYNPLVSNTSALLGTFSFSQDSPVKIGTAGSRTTTSLTDPALIGNTLIAVGQKVTLGGDKRTISAWSPASGTVTWADGAVAVGLTAYEIRLAVSIDHKDIVESWGGSSVVNDDGDGYVEYLKQDSGSTYTWFVDINSNNIPDGPIEIHYVVFDSSENATHYQTTGYKIQNNGPRVSAVWLGTDLDLNGSINELAESTERELFAFADGTTDLLSTTTSFKVKEAPMYLLPVVTNGNGDLTLVLSAGTSTATLAQIGTYSTLRTGSGGSLVPLTLNATTLDGVGEGIRTFRFVVWDTTEETTPRTDSLSMTRDVVCELARVDNVIPTAAIRPFYWNTASDNSLYGASRSNGHIEISGVFDGSDPDVSGGVSFRGVAFDDQRLTAIWMYVGDGTSDTGAFTFTGSAATRTFGGLTYYRVAGYSSGAWTGAGSYATDGWRFDVTSDSIGQSGHRSDWRLDWNSAKISGTAAKNRVVSVVVEDKKAGTANPSSTAAAPVVWSGTGTRGTSLTLTHAALIGQSVALGFPVILGTGDAAYYTRVAAFNSTTGTVTLAAAVDTAQTAYRILSDADNEPSYQIDITPYINSVSTTINSLVLADFNRSARGRYPISSGEAVTVSGFNLAPTTLSGASSDVRLSIDPDAYDATYTTKQGSGLTSSAASSDFSTLTVTVSATGSGYLTVIANGVPSINNANAAVVYNQESSSIHQSVYDDRFFSLWSLTTLRTNAAAPNAKNALYPSMALNGNTPQFAYVNNSGGYGLAEYWNGTAETKMYENWDLFTFTNLALNDSGSRAALYDINIVQSGTNYIGDKGGITVNFFYNPPDTTWGGTTYYYRDNNVWLDNLYKTGNLAVLDRYRFPDIKMVGTDAASQTFYAVYDSIDDRVLFRYFRIGTNQTTVGGGTAGNATRINDSGTALYVNNLDLVQRNQNNTWPVYTDNGTNNTRFGQNNNSGNTNAAQTIATGAGEHIAVEGTSAGYALIVYYRTSDNALVYQYNTNPTGTTWSSPLTIDSNIGAEYIDMVVDSADHVHIAYYDSFNGDVKYVYLDTYDSTSYTRTKVDSYLSVGSKLSLALNASDVPYISYRGVGNTAKVAWLVGALGNGVDGSDKFNGIWEVQVLPQRIIDSDSNRFNVGVGTDSRPVVGYSNAQSGLKGIEYVTGLADLLN
ncbi:MAG: Ig-like domain-containing protein, partial [Treponemataceae bacterium]